MIDRRGGLWFRLQWWVAPVILALCVTAPKMTQGSFRSDTGWYAAIAIQGWREGSLWTLQAEPGLAFFNKPPLPLWIHGLALWVAGPEIWAARAPSVVAVLLCVVLSAAIARELCGRRVALLTGIIVALTPEMMRPARAISLDLWQLLFMLCAMWLVVMGSQRGQRSLIALSGAPIGLALLCKPLVALLALVLLAVWLIAIGQRRTLGALGAAMVIAALVAAPWHISMAVTHGAEFTSQYFGNQIVDRAAGRLGNIDRRGASPMYYAIELLESYWPWLPVAGAGLVAACRGRFGRDRAAILLAVIWVVGWLIALSVFADRRSRYALPIYPMLAIPAALVLARIPAAWLRRARRGMVRWAAPVGVAFAVIVAMLPVTVHRGEHPSWQQLLDWIEHSGVEELWQGGFEGSRSARLYLELGWWPQTTHDHAGRRLREPPQSARILYHWRDGLAPGPGERRVFQSDSRMLTVTELERLPWNPRSVEDPGEDGLDLIDAVDPA